MTETIFLLKNSNDAKAVNVYITYTKCTKLINLVNRLGNEQIVNVKSSLKWPITFQTSMLRVYPQAKKKGRTLKIRKEHFWYS